MNRYIAFKLFALTCLLVVFSTCAWAGGSTYSSVRTDQKVAALTFDDGPTNPYTPEVLDILKKHGVKATFFVTGENAHAHPALLKRMMAEGHEIGNHTWNHPMMKFKSAKYIRDQIERTDEAIRAAGYTGTIHFRCPYGLRPAALPLVLKDMGKEHILFSVDPTDWRKPSASTITKRILNQTRPGAFVLMHDGGGNRSHTVAALDGVIDGLKAKGYSFVTVQEMLDLRTENKPAEHESAKEAVPQNTPQPIAK